MAKDCITLKVPAKSEYAKTVRMTAAALVSRMDMTYDDVDDVRMAAEEAFVFAADTMGEEDDVAFLFEVGDNEITIKVTLGSEADASDEEVERRTSYATFILQSVCDSFELASDAEGTPSLRLTKRAETADAS